MLIKIAIDGFVGLRNKIYRSKTGLWVPLFDALVSKHCNVLAVLKNEEGKWLIPASNLVTDAGDIHMSQRSVSETLTNAFGIGELASATPTHGKGDNRGTAGYTMIGSTQKAHSSGYPKRNDGDEDNTGAGANIITFLQNYTKTDFNAASIKGGIITSVSPGASEPILTGFDFTSVFAKTANDTLKVFENITLIGM